MGRQVQSGWLGLSLLVAVLVACGETAPEVSESSQPTRGNERLWSDIKSVPGLNRAVARLRDNMNVPITLPSKIPRGTRLDPRKPLRFHRSGVDRTAVLHLVFGRKKHLYIQYGQATFDGCGGDRAKAVKVGGKPGLLSVSPIATWSELIWPALPRNPQGRYGLAGSFSGAELLALAESMDVSHAVSSTGALTGC